MRKLLVVCIGLALVLIGLSGLGWAQTAATRSAAPIAVKAPPGWYDISVPLKQGMVYYPTDPAPPKIYRYSDRELGSPVTMTMRKSSESTHIDAPLHFIAGGSRYPTCR
jgi:hypothetical protein